MSCARHIGVAPRAAIYYIQNLSKKAINNIGKGTTLGYATGTGEGVTDIAMYDIVQLG